MPWIVASAVAVATLAGLTACAPAAPARTRPNPVERAALASAGNYFGHTDAPDSWVQLWTPAQAGPAIERCISTRSGGVISATVSFMPDGIAVGFDYGALGGASPDDVTKYASSDGAQQVANECFAATPVDDRIDLLPERDRGGLYSYDVTVLSRCLREHGQPVGRIPSRERFESLLRAGAPWSPYDRVVVKSRAAWFALSDACPVFPLLIAGDIAAVSSSATTP